MHKVKTSRPVIATVCCWRFKLQSSGRVLKGMSIHRSGLIALLLMASNLIPTTVAQGDGSGFQRYARLFGIYAGGRHLGAEVTPPNRQVVEAR